MRGQTRRWPTLDETERFGRFHGRMRISRLASVTAGAALVLGLVPAFTTAASASSATATAATAGITVPVGLTAYRNPSALDTIDISWKPVPGVDHYMVRVNDGARDTNYIVGGAKTTWTHQGAGVCTVYKVTVSAVAADGTQKDSGAVWVSSLAPGGVVGVNGLRNELGAAAAVSWSSPTRAGYVPVDGYHVVVRSMATGKLVLDSDSAGLKFAVSGLDPLQMYTSKITAHNKFGSCVTSTFTLGNNRPSSPKFSIRRSAVDPSQEIVSWDAPVWQGYGSVTSYLVGYKNVLQKSYTWIKVAPTARTFTIPALDPAVNWTFVTRAISSNDIGLLSRTNVQVRSGYQPVAATVKVSGGASSITVDFSAPVGLAVNYPTARIDVARSNGTGGWSDSHTVTNGAGQSLFLPVPCGVWAVTVTGQGSGLTQEASRSVVRVCDPAPVCFTSTLQNGGFESPLLPAKSYKFVPAATAGLAWKNLAESVVELWSTGFGGVQSSEGNQFAEINANKAGTLYQDLPTVPGTTMRWHLKHRGRSGVDTMRVMIGAPTGALGQSGANISTGKTAWQQYTGTYTVPAGQTTTRFAFQAVTAGSVGNFLDDIVFTPESCQ